MNIKKINEKITEYKKWFQTCLMEEYFNLPFEKQKEFITMIKDFLQKCEKINEEAKNIKEKKFQIKVLDVTPLHTKDFLVTGFIQNQEVKTVFPSSEPKPEKGGFVDCILYSIDDRNWYSSKEELVKEVYND